MGGRISKCDVMILYSEIHQHLKDLHSSLKQYFPNDQCMTLKKHCMGRIFTESVK